MKTKEELFSKLPRVKATDKIMLLTHTDLDGSGAVVVLKYIFNDVTWTHCSNNSMNYKIYDAIKMNHINNYYDFIIITDISVNKETAEIINDEFGDDNNFIILDHHKTALYLNEYNWAAVSPELVSDSFRADKYNEAILYNNIDPDAPRSSSGTSLLYDYLDYIGCTKPFRDLYLKEFVHRVATYDTFDWKNTFNAPSFKRLNMIFTIYGQEMFEDQFLKFFNGDISFNEFKSINDMLIEIEESKRDSYLNYVKNTGFIKGELTYKDNIYSVSIWPGNNYLPDVFDIMKQESPSDLYVIYYFTGDQETVSLRSDNIDLSELAADYGGGGHSAAAGFPIKREIQFGHISDLFNGDLSVFMEDYC